MGSQDPAPGDAAAAAAQARHAALQEDPSSQGQGRGRRLPEAAQPAPEGGARQEDGEDLAAQVRPLEPRQRGVDRWSTRKFLISLSRSRQPLLVVGPGYSKWARSVR